MEHGGTLHIIGTVAGSVGSEAGSVGSEAGSVGSEAGSAGSEAGSAGSEARSVGSEARSVGSEAGGAGAEAGSADSVAGNAYRMQFIDSGRGMSEEERAKLFHPFRSFFDGGTGIGMAIVYRIVEEHRGRLWAQSRPGEGTTVTVELPGVETARDKLPAEVQAK